MMMGLDKFTGSAFLALLLLASAVFLQSRAHAHTVAIDPGVYAGQWRVDAGGYVAGAQSVDLATGAHTILVGAAGGFFITVDSSGNVSVDNGISATGGAGSLTFITQGVLIDPDAFGGQWRIRRADLDAFATGTRTAQLLPGVRFLVFAGEAGGFFISVDAAGAVAVENGVSAIGGSNSLTFNTVSVNVDPGAFGGQWRVKRADPSGYTTGPGTAIFVPAVSFQVFAGEGGAFSASADAAGVVTVDNGVSAVGGPNTLTFNTVTVDIDPVAFTGQWRIRRGDPAVFDTGPRTATVVPGVLFQVVAGEAGGFFATPDAAGVVTVSNGVSAVGGLNTLAFNTVSVDIDPGEFSGQWRIKRGDLDAFATGPRTSLFIPGVLFLVFTGEVGGFFVIADATGDVEVTNGISGVGGPSLLTFNTSTITIDPGAFAGNYEVRRVETLSGASTIKLVPGALFQLRVGTMGEFFQVAEPCSVSPASIVLDGDNFALDCGCDDGDSDGVCDVDDLCPMDANNDADDDGVCGDVDICSGDDASGDSDSDGICNDIDACFGNNATGDADVDGICNDNDLCAGTDATGDSDGDGICDSDDLCVGDDATGDSDGDLVCDDLDACLGADASGDTDADETCDDSDVCPLDPLNDEDGDGVCADLDQCLGDDSTGDDDLDDICNDQDLCLGNDVTGDADGDTVCDDRDNCVNDINPGQEDADADAIGDACEADSDSDGVLDDVDNCVDVSNSGQSDADLDGLGDPCDDDDDNDTVFDADDNCPLYANTDQADFDADGFGDVCDGDDDADGVGDDTDLCPGTPIAELFDDDGCSGRQYIELQCGVPSDYQRHGHYVRCVVHASRTAQRRGLITRQERARIIRRAARGVWRVYRRRLRRWC